MEDLTIGQRIAVKRKELGMSQIDLGEKMGVSRQSISKWESDGALPEIDKLIALSKLFHVSVGWLLGVEEAPEPQVPPEQTFTQREWEIIDRLAQDKPRLPRWLLPLSAAAAAVSLAAALLSGGAFYANHRRAEELAAIRQSVANLATDLGVGLPEEKLLADYTFLAQPMPDLNECSFQFQGVPACHDPESAAELIVTLDSEVILRQECRFDGWSYTAAFTLPVRNGYTASFRLTGEDGTAHTSRVYDPLLVKLADQRHPGEVSVNWDRYTLLSGCLTFENMQFHIEAPGIFRDTPELWTRCDLVILEDGKELGRTDILNRSPYSKSINFSSPKVDFFTREQSVILPDTPGTGMLEVLLDCELATGLQLRKVLGTLSRIPEG